MADLLSMEDYINLLALRFNNPEIKFQNAEIKSFTEDLEGFTGEHNLLQISYSLNNESKIVNFFVKSKPKNQTSNDIAEKLLVYEKEIFFYSKLMKEFEQRRFDTSFAPKTYLCKANNLLVMNDLKSEGYYLSGRTLFYNLEKTKSSLKALASFHGASFIYEEQKSIELKKSFRLGMEYPNEFIEKFLDFTDKEGIGYTYFYKSRECFENMIDLFDENKAWKQEFKERLNNKNFLELFTCDLGFRKALGHGDLWSNNMLFKQNEQLCCCIFDYQALRYYNPAFDVLYIIFANTRKELRDVHFAKLVEYYYDVLTEILAQKDLSIDDIYSKEDYMKSIDYYKFLVKYNTSCAHTLTFLDVTKVTEVIGTVSTDNDKNFIRLEAYKHDELFREIMKENLYEIRDLLFDEPL